MWGRALTEANSIQNFNFGFSTYKSDILVHLSQWQYWWWFWFTLLWTVYLFFILTLIQRRTYQFNPVLNTSIRGHGKWGDFLVALIPLSWCGNILVNSNFILRMIEWQNESSLFTIRVQGKQWYWVYKYDATAAQAILTAPKNVGHNNWFVRVAGESLCADSYYQALQLGTQLEFNQMYLAMLHDKKLNKQTLNTDLSVSQPITLTNTNSASKFTYRYFVPKLHLSFVFKKTTLTQIWGKYVLKHLQSSFNTNQQKIVLLNNLLALKTNNIRNLIKNHTKFESVFTSSVFTPSYKKRYKILLLDTLDRFLGVSTFSSRSNFSCISKYSFRSTTINVLRGYMPPHLRKKCNILTEHTVTEFSFFENLINQRKLHAKIVNHYDYNSLEDTQDFSANKIEINSTRPLKILKGILNIHNLNLVYNFSGGTLPNILFIAQLENNKSALATKPDQGELLWGFKQKKYKRLQKFKYTPSFEYDHNTLAPKTTSPVLTNLVFKSSLFSDFEDSAIHKANAYQYQKSVKLNRHRSELVPVTLARRLLRTKRTLVLPAHTNLTVITNSYDVVHSWFIPGLGIKLDCVPGRSTHHTFYIDNIGFYYGQCAEICGRYHHHMPIRICALPFEQFLMWWQKRGLRRMHRVKTIKNLSSMDTEKINFRYKW